MKILEMNTKKIIVKNRTNWFLALILTISLIILLFMIVVILPLMTIQSTYFLSIACYLYSLILPLSFFIFFLYIWLWNTFGKTVLEIYSDRIVVSTKYKLFNKPKIYLKSEIQKIDILDLSIERTKYNFRLNYLFSNSNQSIVLFMNNETIRIIDWLQLHEAHKILEQIKQGLYFL